MTCMVETRIFLHSVRLEVVDAEIQAPKDRRAQAVANTPAATVRLSDLLLENRTPPQSPMRAPAAIATAGALASVSAATQASSSTSVSMAARVHIRGQSKTTPHPPVTVKRPSHALYPAVLNARDIEYCKWVEEGEGDGGGGGQPAAQDGGSFLFEVVDRLCNPRPHGAGADSVDGLAEGGDGSQGLDALWQQGAMTQLTSARRGVYGLAAALRAGSQQGAVQQDDAAEAGQGSRARQPRAQEAPEHKTAFNAAGAARRHAPRTPQAAAAAAANGRPAKGMSRWGAVRRHVSGRDDAVRAIPGCSLTVAAPPPQPDAISIASCT